MHGRAAVWHSYLRLLQMGFTKPRRCRRAGALLPHRFSFSPVSRMLRIAACSEQGSLLFCGTDPSGRPAQPLAGILPLGARTFLMLAHAIARLTRGCIIHCSTNNVLDRRCDQAKHLIFPLRAYLTSEARLEFCSGKLSRMHPLGCLVWDQICHWHVCRRKSKAPGLPLLTGMDLRVSGNSSMMFPRSLTSAFVFWFHG